MSSADVISVVMDIGSDSCKVGFAGDQAPKSVVPSVVGLQGQKEVSVGVDNARRNYVGQDAFELGDLAALKYPVERGEVTDWKSMEIILDHIFKDKLSTRPTEHPVLVTETPQNPKKNREKMAELMFEKFQVPAFFSSCQAVLCLYSAGRSTGLVLDIGSGVTTAVPVYEGYSLSEGVVRGNYAGLDISDYLSQLLSGRGNQFNTVSDKNHLKNIKEKLCYVAQDFDKELAGFSKSSSSAAYELPDKKVISVETERFRCTELLFKPSIAGISEKPGIHEMINRAISACELDTRKSLYTNIILNGGSTLFDGLVNRLKTELSAFGAMGAEARVSAPKDRILSAWSGGSVLASLSSFESNWISKKQYEESGPQIVHSRCF